MISILLRHEIHTEMFYHFFVNFSILGIPLKDIKPLTDFKMLETLPPDSDEQQYHITAIQNEDGYNWGWDTVLLMF